MGISNTTFVDSSSPLRPTPLITIMSDKQLSLFLPLFIYWIYSGFFHLISTYKVSFFEKYRLHNSYEMEKKNKVSMGEVIRGVLLQQFLQTLLGLLVVVAEDEDVLVDDEFELNRYHQNWNNFGTQLGLKQYFASFEHIIIPLAYWYLIPLLKFVAAMIILDTWQYFMHRLFHQNSFLYRHIHSRHHLLYVPYAFGALYNHPVEGFVLDSVGASLAFKMSGLATRGAMLFFSFATLKTVDDHCGYDLPFDPIQLIFGNNSLYHDIHHQVYGIKMNFSQPFFTIWDRILGTYMPYPPVSKPSTPKVETTKIKIFSLKDYLANGGDEINIKDFEKSVTTGNSPLRYNLRPRKAVSSL